ncbi:MAG TPA: hypothetical protein DIC35_01870 [Candidatus Moranbacteria bacterium]|nr:hypothetical protein [Candidatus Moranbacteria bacterium]
MEEKLSLLLDFFITLTMGGLGFIVYYQQKKSFTNKLFLLFTISLVTWVNFNFFENWVKDESLAKIFLKLDFMSAPIGVFFISLFLVNFPRPESRITLKKSLFLFAPAFLASSFAASDLIIKDVFFENDKIGFYDGTFFYLYALVIVGYSFFGLGVLSWRIKKSNKKEKKQMKLILWGFSIMLVFFMVFNLVLQNYVSKVIFRVNTFSPILLIVITGYAIYKHQLFNIKVFSAQLMTLLIWVFIFLQFFFINNWMNYVVTSITFFIAVFFGILLIRSVKNEIDKKEELEIANNKLLKMDEIKSEFISMASHQLRTPLTSMKGFLSIMKKGVYGEVPESLNEPVRFIEAANDRLIMLVEDMLNVSQIEAGRMSFNFKKENVNEVVQEIFHSFTVMAQEKNLKLEISLAKRLPKISMDYGKIRETISNIVDNAIKYTQSGSVRMETIRKENVVQIVISDTGIGIDKKGFEFLFDKFARGEKAQEIKKSGVGLGLYLGKRIIEAHQGKIKVKSEGREKGAIFTVELPIDKK